MILMDDLDLYAYELGLPRWVAPFVIFINPATWAIIVYRFGSWVYNKCYVALLKQILFIFYFILKIITQTLTGIEISHKASIGRGLYIAHTGNIIIGMGKIGDYPVFTNGVTVGFAGRDEKFGVPTIGNFVYFGAGAKVLGKIIIGNCVAIGANAVVINDFQSNAVVAGVPAKVISYEGSEFFTKCRVRKLKD